MGLEFQLTTTGLGDVLQAVKRLKGLIGVAVGKEIKSRSEKSAKDYRRKLSKHKKSGGLEKSVIADSNTNFMTDAEIGSTSKVATYFEYGTKAHGPKRAKMLHWKDGNIDIWAKWVKGINKESPLLKVYLENWYGLKFDKAIERRMRNAKL